MDAFTKISKGRLGDCARIRMIAGSTLEDAVRSYVKLKIYWRPQGVMNVKNIEYLSRKATGSEWKQPRERLSGLQIAKP